LGAGGCRTQSTPHCLRVDPGRQQDPDLSVSSQSGLSLARNSACSDPAHQAGRSQDGLVEESVSLPLLPGVSSYTTLFFFVNNAAAQ